MPLDSWNAGRAAQPGPFTSVLKERGGGQDKICFLVCSALWIKEKHKKEETKRRKLHAANVQGYLLTVPSLEDNIERNFHKTQVRTFPFFAVNVFSSVGFPQAVSNCFYLR